MSDDRIIDFNEIKNKVKDKDVDKFEDYMYSMYYDMASGKINMADFTKNLMQYVSDNNISQDKLMKIQMKFLERYGIDPKALEGQFDLSGIDMNSLGALGINYDGARKTIGFSEKYKNGLKVKTYSEYKISNDKNNLKVLLEDTNVIIISEKNINLSDNELNEFLCSYKKIVEDKNLNITICENSKNYEYNL